MFHKVERVEALDDYILKVEFQDGSIKYYDVKNFNIMKIFHH